MASKLDLNMPKVRFIPRPPQNPPPGFIDRETLVLNKEGLWIADGQEITHKPTAKLFHQSIFKDEKGYYLHIGKETKAFEVEEFAFCITSISGSLENGIQLHLSDDTVENLDEHTLEYRANQLTCRIKENTETARFLRKPYYEILSSIEKDKSGYFLIYKNHKVTL